MAISSKLTSLRLLARVVESLFRDMTSQWPVPRNKKRLGIASTLGPAFNCVGVPQSSSTYHKHNQGQQPVARTRLRRDSLLVISHNVRRVCYRQHLFLKDTKRLK